MFVLSAFGDEISSELDDQLDLLESEGIKHLDIRAVWERNVKDLTDDDLDKIKDELDKRKFKISTIASPIGKIKISDDFDSHLKTFDRMIHLAKFFNTKYIRVFSYYIPKGDKPETYRDEVMKRMKTKADIALKNDIVLVLENESELYGEKPQYVFDIAKTINSPALKILFDAANYVIAGVKPHTEAYPIVKDYLEMFHIKDAIKKVPWEITPAGEGEGQIPDTLKLYIDSTKNILLVIEPHLAKAGKLSGFSGPDKFRIAIKAVKNILNELGAKFE